MASPWCGVGDCANLDRIRTQHRGPQPSRQLLGGGCGSPRKRSSHADTIVSRLHLLRRRRCRARGHFSAAMRAAADERAAAAVEMHALARIFGDGD
eukprot:1439681-Prymnesium_polylepis.2